MVLKRVAKRIKGGNHLRPRRSPAHRVCARASSRLKVPGHKLGCILTYYPRAARTGPGQA